MEKVNKYWCIGDIHGCYQELMALYNQLLKAGLKPEKDVVVFLGDYMDRGPDSKKVVIQLMKWHKQYPHWVFIYGNHEDILKNWVEGKQKYQEDKVWSCFLYNGGKETLKSYGITEPDRTRFPKKHLEFLFQETKLLYETDDYVFVHGGLTPELPISEQTSNQTYIDAVLWARETFINSMWDWGKKVIFGHTPAHKPWWGKFGQPIIMDNKIGLDGAVCPSANKNLLAVELPAENFYAQESFDFFNKILTYNKR